MENVAGRITVEDVREEHHLEARVGQELAGRADCIRTDRLIAFVHTEVLPAHEGQDVGSALARAALEHAKTLDLQILPVCPFIAGWMDRHPEYAELRYKPTSRVKD
ncbi:GNAT family N-acetyltransferase [Kitasatospora sp. NPDC058063]|uniref:GNAT family N-acetyltransferase n=1 Tax=unclassified Kitasatospora TaxID=2633591 RepID=UPI0036DF0F7B